MKISKYTFFIEEHGNSCLYNTLSNSLITVDKPLYDKLKHLVNVKQFDDNALNEDKENIVLLKKGKFLTENDMDDFLQFKATLSSYRVYSKSLGLTIAPTLDCNYNCYYCFEEHHNEYMTSEEIDAIISYINSKKDIDFLNITWFGGEPLMAFDKINEFYQKFRSPIKDIHSAVITNAYYMTPDVVKMLNNYKFNRIQVSIDGIGDNYNTVKYSKTDRNCWNTILNNMDYLIANSQIYMNIRVNLQSNDSEDFLKIYHYFNNRYANYKHWYIAPAFLTTNRISEQNDMGENFTNQENKVKFELDVSKIMIENNMENKFPFVYPHNQTHECSVRNENFIGIGPGGLLYKCWENIGNKKESFGFLNSEGKINITDRTLFNRYMYGEDPFSDTVCRNCKYLPICLGGCPNWRLRNFYEGTKIDICTNFKLGLSDYLGNRIKSFVKQKEQLEC